MNINQTLLLIGILNVCHYLADYVTVTPWMLAAKSKGKPIWLIILHANEHTLLMGIGICIYCIFFGFLPDLLMALALVLQLISHSIIDIIKGRLNYFECIRNPARKTHWVIFGLDQLMHQTVILLMVYILNLNI